MVDALPISSTISCEHQNKKNSPVWLSAEFQARIKHSLILLIKKYPKESNEYDIIKIKMRWNPSDAASEMYKLKIVTFKHSQPEEFPQLMNNFKREVDRSGTTTVVGKTNYIRTLLHGEAIREFDKLSSQNAGTNIAHLKSIQEGLLGYSFPNQCPFQAEAHDALRYV